MAVNTWQMLDKLFIKSREIAIILMRMNGTKGVNTLGDDFKRLNSKTVTASGAPFAVPACGLA